MKAKAYMIGIPSTEFNVMPICELGDIINAYDILNGLCDEYIESEYIPVDLR